MSAPPKRTAACAGLPDAPPPHPPPRPPGAHLLDPAYGPPPSTDYADLPAMLGHPDLGRVILGWLGDDTRAASALRGTCTAARDAVSAYAWADERTIVRWPARWRRAFPVAVAASVRRNRRLRDADFVHLRGLRSLDMSWCSQTTITDAAFAHLVGIYTLKMSWCSQATITDGAFAHRCARASSTRSTRVLSLAQPEVDLITVTGTSTHGPIHYRHAASALTPPA